MPYSRKTRRRPSISKRAKIVSIIALSLAVVLAFSGLYLKRHETITANAAEVESYNAQVTAPAALATDDPAPEAPAATAIGEIIRGQEDVVISVLGDSTGNAPGEWVDLWAKDLTPYGSVTLHMWDQKTEQYQATITYPGEGKQITIWNGAMPGALADYPADKLAAIQPEAPDVTLLSYGHNGSPDIIASGFQATYDAVLESAPETKVAAIIQNAAVLPRGPRTDENQFQVRRWAEARGVTAIDIRAAFDAEPDLNLLLLNDGLGVHPNEAGSRIWADALNAAL